MAYLMINGVDLSNYVSMLKTGKKHNFKSMVTAAGNTLVKPINSKRIIEVGFTSLNASQMAIVQKAVKSLTLTVSYRDSETNTLVQNVRCMLPQFLTEYYTIQDDIVLYKPFSIQLTEL